MIVNVINKKLSLEEKELFNKLSKLVTVVNIDFHNFNDDIKVHLKDLEKDEREILIDANDSQAIVFWGFPSEEEYQLKVFHSLLERRNVYFASLNDESSLYYEKLRNELPSLYSKLIDNFLVVNKVGVENEYTVEDITKFASSSTNSVVEGVKEIFENRHMITKMAYSIFQQETLKTTLGSYWHIVRDIVVFITYLLFMIFMRGFGDIEGVPVIMYLVSGLVAWYYMSDIIGGGAACIRNSRGIISKVKFPVTIIPIYHSLAIFYRRGLTYIILVVIVAIYLISGTPGVEVNLLKFIYYTVSMIIFMFAFNLLFSALVAISRDFHELYKSFVRIQMYFNPIFWDITSVQNKLENSSSALVNFMELPFNIMMLNPTVYILTGYRESFGALRTNSILTTVVFWIIVLLMYGIGFKLQARVRSLYADII